MSSTTIIASHRNSHRRPIGEPIRTTTRNNNGDPFSKRFGHNLPKGLREEACGMEWRTFINTYSPQGNIRIRNLESTKLRAGMFHFTATLTEGNGTQANNTPSTITATGPISACTHLLADAGRRVEILNFHQFEIFEATVTFIYTCDNNKYAWAMGFGATPQLSIASALSSAAERLHG